MLRIAFFSQQKWLLSDKGYHSICITFALVDKVLALPSNAANYLCSTTLGN